MQTADLAVVARLEQEIFPDPWDTGGMDKLLGETASMAIVAELEGHIAGYAFCWMLEGQWEILNFAVTGSARRRGIGDRMMDELLEAAQTAGCREGFLEVRQSNDAAIRLYNKYDFETVGIRRHYYNDGEDALVMHRANNTR
jgi:[ribosomal protein S18]-alanine N-acetyltransferase